MWRAQWKDIEVGIHKIKTDNIDFIYLWKHFHSLCKIEQFNVIKLYGLCEIDSDEIWFVTMFYDTVSIFNVLSDPFQNVVFSTRWQWGQQVVSTVLNCDIGDFLILPSNFLLVNEQIKYLPLAHLLQKDILIICYCKFFGTINNVEFKQLSKIHSLGMVLSKILSRDINISNLNNEQLFQIMKNEKIHDVKDVPELMINIIKRCWTKDIKHSPSLKEIDEYFVKNSKKLEF